MIKGFKQYLTEKLILFNQGKRYGQIVVMGGGAGSGKSYVAKNYIESEKFKTIDVDAWKEAFVKLKRYPDWKDFDFGNPSSVSRLHIWIMKQKIRNKVLDLLFKTPRNKEVLPNILFDISLNTPKQLESIVDLAIEAGYSPNNIHLVYVLTDWETAIKRNKARTRTLPDTIVFKTLLKAAETVTNLIRGGLPKGFNGTVKVVTNTSKELEYITIKKEGRAIISKNTWLDKLNALITQHIGSMPKEKKKKK